MEQPIIVELLFAGAHLLTYSGHSGPVTCVSWAPDSKLIVSSGGSTNVVQVWDANAGKALDIYPGHVVDVSVVGWSTDGKLIASGSADATVQVWSIG